MNNDATNFTSCCGLRLWFTPLRRWYFDQRRGLHYRGPWRLLGPDSHRRAIATLSLSYVMTTPLYS